MLKLPMSFNHIPSLDGRSRRINVIVETPAGSRAKYDFDAEDGIFRLSKLLPQGMCFPYDFGFIPCTMGEDGDPLDVLVVSGIPNFPGCLVTARLLGVLEAEQSVKGKRRLIRNDRLIAALETPKNPAQFQTLKALGQKNLREIENFFVTYNRVAGKLFRPLGYFGPKQANFLLRQGKDLFAWRQGK